MNGEVIAVYGQVMFKDVRDVHTLARKLNVLEEKIEFYEKELESLRSSKYTINNIVGNSQEIVELKKLALKAARTNAPVLLMGESGTGKELFAHAIHHASQRRPYPFVRLNCAAIPKDLLEAELFGYEPGAFTGAGIKGKPGKFELAHRGTIFLDEISDLPLEMQPKLLRVLEEKETERLGGTHPTKCDFRSDRSDPREPGKMCGPGEVQKGSILSTECDPHSDPSPPGEKRGHPNHRHAPYQNAKQRFGNECNKDFSRGIKNFRKL